MQAKLCFMCQAWPWTWSYIVTYCCKEMRFCGDGYSTIIIQLMKVQNIYLKLILIRINVCECWNCLYAPKKGKRNRKVLIRRWRRRHYKNTTNSQVSGYGTKRDLIVQPKLQLAENNVFSWKSKFLNHILGGQNLIFKFID